MNWIVPDDKNEFVKIESINRYLKKAKAPTTYKYWKYNLYDFFEFIKIHPDQFVKFDRNKIEDLIESYVDYLKARVGHNEINPNSVEIIVVPLKKFLIFNRVEGVAEAWVRIKANFPPKIRSTDEKYNEIELQKMYNIADFREKAVLGLLMSGMRRGGIHDLRIRDLKPIEDWVAVRVYAGAKEEYYAFVTPQGYRDIHAYLDFRSRNGENITQDSPLIRRSFRPECAGEWTDEYGVRHDVEPIHTVSGTAEIVINLVRKAGIIGNSHNAKTRHKTMTCHGFRKYFNTICKTSGMDSERVEMLMGHANSSLSGHYWRLPTDETGMSPQEQKMFQTIKNEFRRCIPELTIGESEILRIQNEELQETVSVQMKQKDIEILELQRQLSKVKQNPFLGMPQEKIEEFVQMLEDWKKLKHDLNTN
ncbi:MAG: site-specific integrase [Thaumarchaeota archaeon]|nr:site-specific integrase [Nitrososphaerota archaeon]